MAQKRKRRGFRRGLVVFGLFVCVPALASAVFSYLFSLYDSGLLIRITFSALVIAAVVVSHFYDRGKNNMLRSLLLAGYYCASSVLAGSVLLFAFRLMDVPWTMHIKDPGFGLGMPIIAFGHYAFVIALVCIALYSNLSRKNRDTGDSNP